MRLKMVHIALAGVDPSARRRDADLRQKEFLQIGIRCGRVHSSAGISARRRRAPESQKED
ncbi:MAG: hypothetical protein ACLQFW_25060 [Xanthobacteraceae bacterium]